MDCFCLKTGSTGTIRATSISKNVGGGYSHIGTPPAYLLWSRLSFRCPLRFSWPGGEQRKSDVAASTEKVDMLSGENGDDDDDNGGVDEIKFERELFSSLLKKVSIDEAKFYAKLSYLGNLSYYIRAIQPEDLQRCYQLRFVTSSLEMKQELAAELLQSRTKIIIPLKSPENNTSNDLFNSEIASFMANEDDLDSNRSSPCEWYVCDDDRSGTRYFVIQGSESVTSWQANLLFEPVQFEGLNVPVHRGIYEAAKMIYELLLPEIHAHLKSHGDHATLRFTGHSLGGSLALLVNLMLLIRGQVSVSSLLPVIAFGAPYVMCGGDCLLRILGLAPNHYQMIALHRDIVPRAFSANLSDYMVDFVKVVNGKLRTHACLSNHKFLYSPMGELLILQPDAEFSPPHHLLPPGDGLYLLTRSIYDGSGSAERLVQAATKVFLNSPHPVEILSDPAAYGSEGTIIRDHDMSSYLDSIRSVIIKDLNQDRSKV